MMKNKSKQRHMLRRGKTNRHRIRKQASALRRVRDDVDGAMTTIARAQHTGEADDTIQEVQATLEYALNDICWLRKHPPH